MAVNCTGEWLAFGCSSLGQLLVWEWQSETYVLKQQGHFYDMNCLSYSPDGQLIATGGDDAKARGRGEGGQRIKEGGEGTICLEGLREGGPYAQREGGTG